MQTFFFFLILNTIGPFLKTNLKKKTTNLAGACCARREGGLCYVSVCYLDLSSVLF